MLLFSFLTVRCHINVYDSEFLARNHTRGSVAFLASDVEILIGVEYSSMPVAALDLGWNPVDPQLRLFHGAPLCDEPPGILE
ncbi:hypothetical protein HMPREF3170_08605 [Corynebacterium sp. HMSC08D02]|nr:hypothetical protein HMPREF3170_08605 [Corynebacterium sp. HMSC08D02]